MSDKRTILLVEDNPAEARLAIEVIGETIEDCALLHATDGAQAMAILRGDGAQRPDLVLLDLNLPGMDGPEVLREIRADPELNTRLRTLPVTVFLQLVRDVVARPLNAQILLANPRSLLCRYGFESTALHEPADSG